MRGRPEGIGEPELGDALRTWGIDVASWTYEPVGFGDYHWTAADTCGRRWFVTVADLAHKSHCGAGADAAFEGLSRAMDTALALRERAGRDFVVAPVPAVGGGTVRRVGARYGVSVFPHAYGVAGRFGDRLGARERGAVLDTLALLHRTPPPQPTPRVRLALPGRAALESALAGLRDPWHGGPYAGRARELTREHAAVLRRRLDEFDRRAGALEGAGGERVVTHGEPHPGNLLRQGAGYALVDWDTVGLALPERDLWLVATGPEDLDRYQDAAGRRPDPEALALHGLRWRLTDVAAFLGDFRSPHAATPDSALAWRSLAGTVRALAETG
ncbi:phosphotransferase family protein [Actinacidiphila glaucinigra]|uniref:phosphotransferase family protein n=1 Tax=Actinacidiphila glaucinigra TaxID=235986 RepID=UPI0037A81B43